MRNLRRRGVVALGLAGLLVGTAACGSDDGGTTDADDGDAEKSGGTMVFGTSADPISMDGAYVSDGESLRVVRQLFETLVTTEPAAPTSFRRSLRSGRPARTAPPGPSSSARA
jgi:peptide/nickel transport system substrate-binding protein